MLTYAKFKFPSSCKVFGELLLSHIDLDLESVSRTFYFKKTCLTFEPS